MNKSFTIIHEKVLNFYQDSIEMPDVEDRLCNYLFAEIVNDLQEKGIKNFGDWLKYHSTNGNNIEEIVSLTEAYYYKALSGDLQHITLLEKIVIFNAIALYGIEMDVDRPTGKLGNTVILTFIEVIRHYNLFVKGYLSLKGEIFISDRTKTKFFSTWSDGSNFKREIPITLFSPNE